MGMWKKYLRIHYQYMLLSTNENESMQSYIVGQKTMPDRQWLSHKDTHSPTTEECLLLLLNLLGFRLQHPLIYRLTRREVCEAGRMQGGGQQLLPKAGQPPAHSYLSSYPYLFVRLERGIHKRNN
jgi:hypothetical protein